MSDMTPEKATALRRPFPKASVGILPKPYKRDSPKGNCNECGGYHGLPAVHLDYVGHAAVTDRLLTVDPGWSWDFAEVDPTTGMPSLRASFDPEKNLWIRLTICGVTRLGVGDGSSMKERIGDAIRNAAMRFGVALDLWAKEDLVEFAQHATAHQAPPPPAAPPPHEPDRDADEPLSEADETPMTARQRGQMFALFEQKGIAEDRQLAYINHITSAGYESRGALTSDHAKQVIKALQQRPDAPKETTDA